MRVQRYYYFHFPQTFRLKIASFARFLPVLTLRLRYKWPWNAPKRRARFGNLLTLRTGLKWRGQGKVRLPGATPSADFGRKHAWQQGLPPDGVYMAAIVCHDENGGGLIPKKWPGTRNVPGRYQFYLFVFAIILYALICLDVPCTCQSGEAMCQRRGLRLPQRCRTPFLHEGRCRGVTR